MSDALRDWLTLDLMALLAAVLAAITCGLIGNFLVLRRMAMMGDAISHAVLPGLVVAFLVTGENTTFPMLFGAAIAGVACAMFVEVVRKLAKLDAGASMGVVFTIMFALGVVLVSALARQTHVDANCVLYGDLEHLALAWIPPERFSQLFSLGSILETPRQVSSLAFTLILTVLFITVLFKELRISCFDPQLATALGINASLMHLLLMLVVALSVVASFEAVGVILVVAMLVCPAAIARMLTDRLRTQVILSGFIAAAIGAGGYFAATRGPALIAGAGASELQVSGMMATLGGLGVGLAVVLSPSHGLVAQRLRRLRHDLNVLGEDQLAMLYRLAEVNGNGDATIDRHHLIAGVTEPGTKSIVSRIALRQNLRQHLLDISSTDPNLFSLTHTGVDAARAVVRTHRLWETYLVREMGLRPDHVHSTAMDLEHITSPDMQTQLDRDTGKPTTDPHGKQIPK